MQITNNNGTSFKAAYIEKCAKLIAQKRMFNSNYAKLEKEFLEKYKDSEFTITVGAAEKEKRLDAIISYNINGKDKNRGTFFRYLEEGIFSSLFRSPKKFFSKIDRVYAESAVPFAQNGFKHIV